LPFYGKVLPQMMSQGAEMTIFLNSIPTNSAISAIKAAQNSINSSMATLATGKNPLSGTNGTSAYSQMAKISSQLSSLESASQNVSKSLSILEAADSSLSEIGDILTRIREIAVQGSSSGITATERANLVSENATLVSELETQSASANHGGFRLLDGTFQGVKIQTGTSIGESFTFSISSAAPSALGSYSSTGALREPLAAAQTAASNNTTNSEDIVLTTNGIEATIDVAAGDSAKTVSGKINAISHETAILSDAQTFAHLFSTNASSANYTIKINDTVTSAFSISNSDVSDAVSKINLISATTGVTATATTTNKVLLHDADGDDITIENAGAGGDLDIKAVGNDGETEGTDTISLGVGGSSNNDSTRVIGILRIYSDDSFAVTQSGSPSTGYATSETATLSSVLAADLSSAISASASLATIDSAINQIAKSTGNIGGFISRIGFVDSYLEAASMTSEIARGRIEDADYAVESARLARAMILQELNTALLAQANSGQELVLKLLEDAA
jgi:flagellin